MKKWKQKKWKIKFQKSIKNMYEYMQEKEIGETEVSFDSVG